MLVSADTSSANTSTGRLSAISDSSGIVSGGTSERIAGSPAYASSVPSAPAASERMRLSVSSCRTRRPRPAPSAARTVISRCRARGPRQQQIRDVRAGDQQQQADRAEQHPDVAGDPARERLLEGQQADAPLIRELGRLPLLQVRDDRRQIRFGLRIGHARLQPSEQVDVAHAFDDPAALERDRHVDVRAAPHEALRHDADHGAHGVVQPKLAAEHVRVAAELALPESIAQHHDRLRAGARIVGRRRPPDERRHAHHVERVERAVVAAQPLRIAVAGPQHVADGRGDDPLEDGVSLGDLDELIDRIAGPESALRRVRHPDAHQVVDVLIGKRIEDDGVEHAVDGRRGHDAERQGHDRQKGEPGTSRQPADAEPHVAPELLDPVQHDVTSFMPQPDHRTQG